MWFRLRLSGSSKIPASSSSSRYADEQLGVVAQQVVVALGRPVHEVGHPDRAEPGDHVGDADRIQISSTRIATRSPSRKMCSCTGSAAELVDGGERGGGDGGVPVIGTREEHRPSRCGGELVHQLAAAAQRADRIAVGHRLAERGQVGRHAAQLLVAAQCVAEAGDHLVKDQHRSVLVAQPPGGLEELLLGQQRSRRCGGSARGSPRRSRRRARRRRPRVRRRR